MQLQHSSDNNNRMFPDLCPNQKRFQRTKMDYLPTVDTENVYAVLHYAGANANEPTTSPGTGGGTLLEEYNLKTLVNPGAPGGSAPADHIIELAFTRDNNNGLRVSRFVLTLFPSMC